METVHTADKKNNTIILILNDDPTQLDLLGALVRKAGFEARPFLTTEAALNSLSTDTPPHLIVTDLYLPDIDGWRFCRLLRSPEYAAFNHIPILVVSATFAGEEADRITREVGANAFLAMPVQGEAFLRQLDILLSGQQEDKKPHVLILEDMKSVAALLDKTFVDNGYIARTVHTGQEALAALQEQSADAVILDFHLPDISGEEVLRRSQPRMPRTAFIMMTADPNAELAVRWMKLGASAYIQKPFNPEYLVQICEKARRERALLMVEERLDIRTHQLVETERQLFRAQKLESLGILAGGIAHDFNNLLMAMLGNLEMALIHTQTVSPAHERISGAILAAKRAAELTRQLLDYVGKGQGVMEPLNLNGLIEENLRIFQSLVSSNITLLRYLDESLPLFPADHAQIQQIIMNLLCNATEAMEEKNGTITLTTGQRICDAAFLSTCEKGEETLPGSFFSLEVADTGCGMDDSVRARLFDPFFTTKFQGRGLGMSAILGIVRRHCGAIHIKSAPQQGTVIAVFFPAPKQYKNQPSPASAQTNTEYKSPQTAFSLSPTERTLLVVDDEDVVRELCVEMVQTLGHSALSVPDGQAALKCFRTSRKKIDGVILDLTMPKMNGLLVFKALRNEAPTLPIILCSGYSNHTLTEQLSDKSCTGFLHKPFSFQQLRMELERLLP